MLLQQGLVALQHGQLSEARQDLEQASRLDPRNPFVWASLAETYLRLGDEKKASKAADAAEKSGPNDPVVGHALGIFYFDYAQILLRRGEFTQAASVVESGLAASRDDAQLTLALGVARYGQRRFEDAVAAFLKVIQIDPQIEQPYIFLGKMLEQAGSRLPDITRAFRAWADANPENARAQLLLAEALLAADSRDPTAEALLRRSIALDSKTWQAHYELGVLLAGKRDYQEAAVELNRAIDLDPKQPEPHYHLARVYDRLGEIDRAKAEREIHERLTSAHTPKRNSEIDH